MLWGVIVVNSPEFAILMFTLRGDAGNPLNIRNGSFPKVVQNRVLGVGVPGQVQAFLSPYLFYVFVNHQD